MSEQSNQHFINSDRNNCHNQTFQNIEQNIMKYADKNVSDSSDFKEKLKLQILERRQEERECKPKFGLFPILASAFIFTIIMVAGGLLYVNLKNGLKIASDNGAINYDNKVASKNSKLFDFTLIKPVFAEIKRVGSKVEPAVPIMRVERNEISNLSDFEKKENVKLSGEQLSALETNGFFLTENNFISSQSTNNVYDDFYDAYNNITGSEIVSKREAGDTVFITSDYILHAYQLLADRSFQKIEESKFQPMLKEITEILFIDSMSKYNKASNEKIKESYKRLAVYYLVPLVVLDAGSKSYETDLDKEDYSTFAEYLSALENIKIRQSDEWSFVLMERVYGDLNLNDEVYDLARKELSLIAEARGLSDSPLFTSLRPLFINDYSQFRPESHYGRNNILKSYYIAMTWYGRMGFSLDSEELTRDAIIITGQINNARFKDVGVADIWSEMSAAIEFFVGEPSDATPYEYTDVIKKVYGEEITESELADISLLKTFIETAKNDLPDPKIISEALSVYDDLDNRAGLLASTKQFRFMGHRFTFDAYVMNSLTQGEGAPDSETGERLPSTPTALMPVSLLNVENKVVSSYLEEWIDENASSSRKVLIKYYEKMSDELDRFDDERWHENVYWAWLNTFGSLLRNYGEGYPIFMQGDAWQKKNLNTVMGSYVELKHNSMVYTKDSHQRFNEVIPSAENVSALPKGYVEPDLEFWGNIIALAKATKEGLIDKSLMPEGYSDKYNSFINACEFFKTISEKELQNEVISDSDFERLRLINYNELAEIFEVESTLSSGTYRAGVIVDVHTDLLNYEVLYEAIGRPNIIYLAVKDANGTRLVRGAVFDHYEFTYSLDTRITDQDWQEIVYGNGYLPEKDKWNLELFR